MCVHTRHYTMQELKVQSGSSAVKIMQPEPTVITDHEVLLTLLLIAKILDKLTFKKNSEL